ncbi:transglutaminase-like cysteine peptidase [Kordiimonas sp. SCSIO 12610]|uniref:transglutaminase-like cysteine peptidase n=1 Tax=Kordiimonas sp. SCSIO 12610 TaxID=2829597 RepID=UPI00210BA4F3|nr:transglutaminase-like cysteine peptidase [Kordiimonas sp. SCSIO 12610]UTW55640.1 transglutaminase-like cysteine peptidase [Kordiimonas sp. SCSIO 12610]
MKIFSLICIWIVSANVYAYNPDIIRLRPDDTQDQEAPDSTPIGQTRSSPFLGLSKGLFQSREIHSANIQRFTKWVDLWRRHNLNSEKIIEPTLPENVRCIGLMRARCNRQAWETFISETASKPSFDMLAKVNRYMNRSPYIVDPVNWGVPDYWATPQEFFFKDGDCEDYAISKYVTLLRLGFDAGQMRLVILQDENLRAAHAVLAVLVDGEQYILDNQIDQVVSHDSILHYRPVYSINKDGWWLHQRQYKRR